MKLFQIFVAFVVLFAGYFGFMVYSVPPGPQMHWASKLALGEFMQRSKAHDYTGARQMLSRRLQSSTSAQTLAQQWKAFEAAHGAIKNWTGANGGRVSIWPQYVIHKHTVSGYKSGSGLVTTRLVPEGKNWRIDQLTIKP